MDPEVLITTSPPALRRGLRRGETGPNTVFFACTDETVHDNAMSGFQARTYEAHYLAGLIAGALSEDGVIGYLANDPTNRKPPAFATPMHSHWARKSQGGNPGAVRARQRPMKNSKR